MNVLIIDDQPDVVKQFRGYHALRYRNAARQRS